MNKPLAFLLLCLAGTAGRADVTITSPPNLSLQNCVFTLTGKVDPGDFPPTTLDVTYGENALYHKTANATFNPASGVWSVEVKMCYGPRLINPITLTVGNGASSASVQVLPRAGGCTEGCPDNARPPLRHTGEPPPCR